MNPSELLSQVWNYNVSGLARPRCWMTPRVNQHFEMLCASFGLSLYEVTKSLNWIPAFIFLARRSRLLKMMMKVIPSRTFELHIVLQSWNESSYDQVGRSYRIPCDGRGRLTSLFTEVSMMAMSDGGTY